MSFRSQRVPSDRRGMRRSVGAAGVGEATGTAEPSAASGLPSSAEAGAAGDSSTDCAAMGAAQRRISAVRRNLVEGRFAMVEGVAEGTVTALGLA